MQDASGAEIKLDDKYVVNGEIELEKEPLVLFFKSNNYSGKNGFSLQKVEYSESSDYTTNLKEISVNEKSYEEETKRYKVTIPLASMQEGKSYYFTLSFAADSGQGRIVKFCIKIKKPVEEEVEKPKSKEPVITAISANPTAAAPEDEVTLEVKAESPDGGTLSYQWYANSKEITPGGDKSRISYTIPGYAADGAEFTFYVKVTNTVQGQDPAEKTSENVTVTVKEILPEPGMAQKPTFEEISPFPEETLKRCSGEKVVLYVKASSSIGNKLVFTWEEGIDDKWEVVDEQEYTLTTENFTGYPKEFTMPSVEGWGIRRYRITVTNIIKLPDGTESSASRSVEFIVEEEPLKPMESPEVTFKVEVKDANGKGYDICKVTNEAEKIFGAYLYSGEPFTITASAGGETLSYKWKVWDYSIEDWKAVAGGDGRSIQGQFDTPSESGKPHKYECIVTNTDPAGIKKAVSTSRQLNLVVSNPLEFIFDAGSGQFADGEKKKSFFIKPEILRTEDEGASQYQFRFAREDFAQWMKEIGMHPDSSASGITNGDIEFSGWKYGKEDWRKGSVLLGFGSKSITFEARWNDSSLLGKMNTLIGMSFNTFATGSPLSVEAEEAEQVDGKIKVYYNLEIEVLPRTAYNKYIYITSNGKKTESKNGEIYGMTNVEVTLNSSGFNDTYTDENYRDYIGGGDSIGFSMFMPVKNCMNAGEEDIAKFFGNSNNYLEKYDKRFSGSPAGVFVCRWEDEHKYRVQFCFYADTVNKTCGIEYFKMNDEDDPSRKCAIYIPCYGITNKGKSSTFTISTTSSVGEFSTTNYGSNYTCNRIDFENEKIYGNIWIEDFYNNTYGDTTSYDDTCPLVFAFDVIGINPDGMSLADDNSSKITYYSVKIVDDDDGSYTPTTFEENQTSDRIKSWSLQKSTGKVYELSTEQKDSGESGLEFFMKTAKKYNCSLRFDLTKFPPQLEIFDATESANP